MAWNPESQYRAFPREVYEKRSRPSNATTPPSHPAYPQRNVSNQVSDNVKTIHRPAVSPANPDTKRFGAYNPRFGGSDVVEGRSPYVQSRVHGTDARGSQQSGVAHKPGKSLARTIFAPVYAIADMVKTDIALKKIEREFAKSQKPTNDSPNSVKASKTQTQRAKDEQRAQRAQRALSAQRKKQEKQKRKEAKMYDGPEW